MKWPAGDQRQIQITKITDEMSCRSFLDTAANPKRTNQIYRKKLTLHVADTL